jgi:WD40 repeat protein
MVYLGKFCVELLLRAVLIFFQTGVPCKWTSDSKRFILDNFDSIQDSPSEMYDFALTLCPPSSWLHECYTTQFSPKVKVVVGPTKWGPCIRMVSFHPYIYALAHWNNTIAAGSADGDINILDAITGSQIATLSGHTGGVRSLAFSSNGTFLISGSNDGTVKLWDVQTGGVVKTLCGHTSLVLSVSISADNTMVASGSFDKTIRLWNIETGDCLIIEGHKEHVNTVSFSPTNSQLLLSSSGDSVVQQWSINGHKIGPPINGQHIAFSPDGTQFVSCNGITVII